MIVVNLLKSLKVENNLDAQNAERKELLRKELIVVNYVKMIISTMSA